MRKKSSIRLGPGAPSLILIFVVLSLAVLVMLSLLSARNDLQLSLRSAQVAEEVYQLREQAEMRRAAAARILTAEGAEALEAALETDDALAGMSAEDGELTWTETDGTRTLYCAVTLDESLAWTSQRLATSIGEDTEMDRETAAKLALADAILARQSALDGMLARCAEGAADWEDYLARIPAAMADEPAAEGVRLEADHLRWVESDGEYSYVCDVVIHPLDAEHRSDFAAIPALIEENEEENP